ncbi:choice-of-anchor I domain-containing protein [Oceanobacillus senegalensis]|uniref:choice-of-anchor I domain-containing protein n=1 Tax=Oceanobacillus senegalensis TaxID=1936063 RepID=UPI000A30CE34|nr:hypothetical protein [Oceanobacillus senegalensis]
MKMKRNVVAGTAAIGALVAAQPVLAAEQPPLFQYQDGELKVTQIAQYDSGEGEGGTEIMAYDSGLQRAFVTNGAAGGFDILSFSDLQSGEFAQVDSEKRVLLSDFKLKNVDDITSIASHPTKDLIAISAVSNPKTNPGYIVFATKDGEYVNHVLVGSMPDMVTFTLDGTKALVANEGEPYDDYTMDPAGSISIIDVTSNHFYVNHLSFNDAVLDEKVRVSSKGKALQQLEPEYITVSDDSKTAYVAMQENNAIATIDLETEKIVDVKGLGVKGHSVSGNELDAKSNGETNIERQPLLGYYMPDAIHTFTVADKTYILTPKRLLDKQ